MERKIKLILALAISCLSLVTVNAQDYPTISPNATFTDAEEHTEEGTSFSGSAPITVKLQANPTATDGWTPYYEWRFYTDNNTSPYLVRYEQNTDFTFNVAGSHRIICYAKFSKSGQTAIEVSNEEEPITISISESKLEMPNAFSPNGDGINDIYKAKAGYQSLVEFHAYIFNRWGQKLYEWDNPANGWDGTYKGKDVKQGVYFVLVKAKGADGRIFNIKKDVNLLRGYTEASTVTE